MYSAAPITIFAASTALMLTVNYTRLFKTIAIIYPLLACIILYNSANVQTLSLFNLVFVSQFTASLRFIAIALMVVTFVINIYALGQSQRLEVIIGGFYSAFTLICLLAADYFSMFIALEMMMLAAGSLIFIGSAPGAARQYFLTHLFSGSLILIAISYIVATTGNTTISLSLEVLGSREQVFYLGVMLVGCLINVGCFPFSSWIVKCYPTASSSGFLYLISFTTKISIVLLIKLFSGFELLKYFGIATMLYGGICACFEQNLRRLFCYLIIAQLGTMLIAIGIGNDYAITSVLSYLPIHLVYSMLLGLVLAVFSDQASIVDCGQISQMKDNKLLLALVIGVLMMTNFPFTASFMNKLVLSKALENEPVSYYLLLFSNVLVFIALPFREYFTIKPSSYITDAKQNRSSIYYAIVCVVLLSVFEINNYLTLPIERIEEFSLSNKVVKQLIIIACGISLAFIIKFQRRDTTYRSFLNIDLLQMVTGIFYRWHLRNMHPKYTADEDDVTLLRQAITNKLANSNLQQINNQQTAILMIFTLFTVLLIGLNFL